MEMGNMSETIYPDQRLVFNAAKNLHPELDNSWPNKMNTGSVKMNSSQSSISLNNQKIIKRFVYINFSN